MIASRAPRFTLKLLEALLPAESREVVIGDLVEQFDAGAVEHPVRARLHFYKEAVAALLPLQFTPAVSAFNPPSMETTVQTFLGDLRHATRVLWRARAFTVLCTLTLGLAIGATTAIVSIVDPLLFASLPYPDANRIVAVSEKSQNGGFSRTTYATYLDLRGASRTIEHAAVMADWQVTIFGDHDGERMQGSRVTWEFFRTLGVHPEIGRDFTADDDTPTNSNVVILSHGLWARRFGGDSSILGRVLDINGVKRTVIGVMPAGFEDALSPIDQIWRPLGYVRGGDSACRTCHHLLMLARVRAGTTVRAASAELNTIATNLAAEYPNDYATPGTVVTGLQESVTRNAHSVLYALLAAVLILLLIAVVNVVNLQLARAARRRNEFAIRAALGAGQVRLAGQLFAEGLVLAVLGGAAGIALAVMILPAMVAQLPASLPQLNAIHLNWAALVSAAAIVLGIAVLTALVPTITTGGRRLFAGLRDGTRALGGTHHRVRAAFVISEVALSMMLLVGTSLLGRSLMRLLSVDGGFEADHLVTMQVEAIGPAYNARAAVQSNHDRMLATVEALPGVEAAGLTTMLPLGGSYDDRGIDVRDKPVSNPALQPSAMRYTITADYLRAMGIRVIRGSAFTEIEGRDTTQHLALVSEAFARQIWPHEDPIGKQFRLGERPWMTVFGVTANVRHTGLDESDRMAFYVPEQQWQDGETDMTLAVRTKGDPSAMVSSIREAVRRVDPQQPIMRIATMESVVSSSTAQRRLGLMLFMAFSALALFLAAAGIYGVLSGSVTERTREIGLRAALGATGSSIVGLVLRQSAGLAGFGLGLGVLGTMGLARYLQSLLFGLQPSDPLSIVIAAGIIAAVALGACVVPARRALVVDPMEALRAG